MTQSSPMKKQPTKKRAAKKGPRAVENPPIKRRNQEKAFDGIMYPLQPLESHQAVMRRACVKTFNQSFTMMSEAMGVTYSTVRMWCIGSTSPGFENLRRLANVTGWTVEMLLSDAPLVIHMGPHTIGPDDPRHSAILTTLQALAPEFSVDLPSPLAPLCQMTPKDWVEPSG